MSSQIRCNWCGEGVKTFGSSGIGNILRMIKIDVNDLVKKQYNIGSSVSTGYYHWLCVESAVFGLGEPFAEDAARLNSLVYNLRNSATEISNNE